MRLRDGLTGLSISHIEVLLQRDEVLELIGALEALVRPEAPSNHEHVSSADYQTEITVSVEEGNER